MSTHGAQLGRRRNEERGWFLVTVHLSRSVSGFYEPRVDSWEVRERVQLRWSTVPSAKLVLLVDYGSKGLGSQFRRRLVL